MSTAGRAAAPGPGTSALVGVVPSLERWLAVNVPTVFIGSSSEGLVVAHSLKRMLEDQGEVNARIWNDDVFQVSEYALESLSAKAREFDFAVLVMTPDDTVVKRGTESFAPRDNVLFEAGLFMGALGRQRTFLVVDRDVALPSDVGGLTVAQYRSPPTESRSAPHYDSELMAFLRPVAQRLLVAIEAAGVRVELSVGKAQDDDFSPLKAAAVAGEAEAAGDAATSVHLRDLLSHIDTLSAHLESMSDSQNLHGDLGRLYGALVEQVRAARPNNAMIAALTRPEETALSGVFRTSVGEARAGLSVLKSALVSGA
jgi:hypothetical protein